MVNDTTACNEEVFLKCADRQFRQSELLKALIAGHNWSVLEDAAVRILIEQQFEERQISADDDEVIAGIKEFRRANGLLTAAQLKTWIQEHRLSDETLIESCRFELCLSKLKRCLFADKVDHYFMQRRAELDAVEIYRICVEKEEAAKEIVASIQDGASFFELARRFSTDETTRRLCGYMGVVKIQTLDAREQELILASREGAIVGPVHVLKNFHVLLIDKFHPASLDEETRRKLIDELWHAYKKDIKLRQNIMPVVTL